MGIRARLVARSAGYVLGGLAIVTPDMLRWPTPCQDWDLRALLAHVDDSINVLREAMTRGAVGPEPQPGDWSLPTAQSNALTLLAFAGAVDESRTVSIGGLPVSIATVCETGALELAVHGWDIATSIGGRARPLPEALARDLLDISTGLIGDVDRPARFAAPVAVRDDADPAHRLLAFAGRTASWAPAQDAR